MALNIWSRLTTEIRSRWTGPLTIKSPEIARHLGLDGGSSTGVPVNEWTALNYSAFWDAVSLIASDVASLPLILYKRVPGGGKSRYTDGNGAKLYRILHDEPNPEMSSIVFRETIQAHALTFGNGYAEIERDGAGKVVALWPLTPDRTAPYRDEFGRLRYRVTSDSGQATVFLPQDILHIPGLGYDGVMGYSVISKARESIGLGLATERFGATFFGNGSTFGGILEHPGVMSDKAEKNFREAIAKRHQGVDRAHKFLVLEEGMKYQKLGIPPDEAQFLESRKFQIEEIARWFRLPPHKIGAMEHATFSNIEHQTLDYVRSCLRSWLVRWEQEYNRKLIATSERNIQFVEHNLEGLLRGDSTARGEFYRTMFNIGAYSVNMILEKENENGIGADGDVHMAPMNMVPLNRLSEVIDAQIAPKTVAAPVQPPAEPKPTRELDMLNELFAAAVTRAEAHLAQAVAADAREAHTAAEKAQAVAERDAERQKFQTAQAEADALRAEIVLTEQRLEREKDEAETRHAEDVATAQRAADAQISDLVGQMASLEARSEEQTAATTRAHEELVAQREALAVVQSALVKADADKDALTVEGRTRIDEWTALEATLRAEASATEGVLAIAKEELAATKREIDWAQSTMAQMRIEQDATLATRAGVEQGLAEQIATLQDVAEALRAETEAKDAETRRLTTNFFELKTIAEATYAELTTTQSDRDAAAAAVAESEARAADLSRRLEEETREKEAEAADLAAALVVASALSAATAADLAAETRQKEEAAAQVVQIQARVANLDTAVAALYAETQTKADALATSAADLMAAQALAESTAGTLAAVQAEREAATTQAVEQRVELERQIADLQAETRSKEEAAAQAVADLMTLRTVAEATKTELDVAASARDTALAQIGEVRGKAQDLEVQLAELRAETTRQEQTAADAQAAVISAEARAKETVQERSAAFVSEQRNKEADRLTAMLTAHRAIMVDAVNRIVRREAERARSKQATPQKLRAWIEAYYLTHADLVTETLLPAVRAHLAWMQSDADPELTARGYADAYVADSKRQMLSIADHDAKDLGEALERVLQHWESKRADAFADRLVAEGIGYVRNYR